MIDNTFTFHVGHNFNGPPFWSSVNQVRFILCISTKNNSMTCAKHILRAGSVGTTHLSRNRCAIEQRKNLRLDEQGGLKELHRTAQTGCSLPVCSCCHSPAGSTTLKSGTTSFPSLQSCFFNIEGLVTQNAQSLKPWKLLWRCEGVGDQKHVLNASIASMPLSLTAASHRRDPKRHGHARPCRRGLFR